MSEDVTIASTTGIATTPQKSVGSPPIGTKDALIMKGRTNPMTERKCISAVKGLSLVRPRLTETRIFTLSLIRKLPWLSTTKKRRSSASLRLYPFI
eukprot:10532992-Ditylum_brightwellii.AAC.1